MDDNGILVGRLFFSICSLISLICYFKYEFVAKDFWKFMRKYQVKSLNEEPSSGYVKMFRVWIFIIFLIFIIQAMALGR